MSITPELLAIVPEEIYAVIRLRAKDVEALHRGMSSATVMRNPSDPDAHEAFMGFYKFIAEVVKNLKEGSGPGDTIG